jgi:hypothetical protein
MTMMLTLLAIATPQVQPAEYKARHRGCHTRACDRRVDRKLTRKRNNHKRRVIRPYLGWLRSTRYCESGSSGLYRTNTGNGFYGAYQFTMRSWFAVGGRGMPHRASKLEQDYRAVRLLHLQGRGAWPVCG